MKQMLIANRLHDGTVVFRATDGSWVESIAAGTMIDDEQRAAQLLECSRADEAANIVIDPNLIGVIERDGVRVPVRIREAIRANGPTSAVDIAKIGR